MLCVVEVVEGMGCVQEVSGANVYEGRVQHT